MTYDPKYKLKHKVTPIKRLSHYGRLPPPMVGDPKWCFRDWNDRCWAIYAAMMAEKRGVIPPHKRRGLWAWYDAPERSLDAGDDCDAGTDQYVVELSTSGAT